MKAVKIEAMLKKPIFITTGILFCFSSSNQIILWRPDFVDRVPKEQILYFSCIFFFVLGVKNLRGHIRHFQQLSQLTKYHTSKSIANQQHQLDN